MFLCIGTYSWHHTIRSVRVYFLQIWVGYWRLKFWKISTNAYCKLELWWCSAHSWNQVRYCAAWAERGHWLRAGNTRPHPPTSKPHLKWSTKVTPVPGSVRIRKVFWTNIDFSYITWTGWKHLLVVWNHAGRSRRCKKVAFESSGWDG